MPPNAGVGSAVGFLAAPIAYEVVRSAWMPLGAFDAQRANALLASMRAQALAIIEPALAGAVPREECVAYVRYVGQNNEIEVPLPPRLLTADDASALRDAFEEAYSRQFTRVIPAAPLEILNWSVKLEAPAAAPDNQAFTASASADIDPVPPQRRVFEPRESRWMQAQAIRRSDLAAGAAIAGPAVIVEKDTATFVTASFTARTDAIGCVRLEPTTTANAA